MKGRENITYSLLIYPWCPYTFKLFYLMKNIKDQKDIGNINQNMEQFLHKESKKIFLAHKTDKYDGVPDQSTKKKIMIAQSDMHVRQLKCFPEEHRNTKCNF